MKIVMITLLFISTNLFSCDGCNVFVNIFPYYYKNSISIYTRNRMIIVEYNVFGQMTLTKHTSHGSDPSFWNSEVFKIIILLKLEVVFIKKKLGKHLYIYLLIIITRLLVIKEICCKWFWRSNSYRIISVI
jgi:hypothetical protein